MGPGRSLRRTSDDGATTSRRRAFAAAFAIAVAAVPTSAHAVTDFSGKTLTVVVPEGPGGSYHLYAQMVQRALGRFLPGRPTIVIQNRQGAGGATAAAYMMHTAPKDGTMIAEVAAGTVTDHLFRPLNYDPSKFLWLGTLGARDYNIAVLRPGKVKNLDETKTVEITLAATGQTSAAYFIPTFINSVLGTKMRPVQGYRSGGEMNLAMERGEIDGRGGYYSAFSVRKDWIDDNKVQWLVTIGPPNPLLGSDVPHLRQLIAPNTIEAKMYELLELNFNVGQGFYVPPGVPDDTLAVLRKAFAEFGRDPQVRQEAISQMALEWEPLAADYVTKAVSSGLAAAEPDVISRLSTILGGQTAK